MAASLQCQECKQGFEAKRSDAKWCPTCRVEVHRKYIREYEHGRRKDCCPKCSAPKGKRAHFCRACNNKQQPWRKVGRDNANWKGGWTKANGYVYIRVSPEPDGPSGPYKAEHRLIWEKHHGPLPKGWVVHHLNGIRDDNRLENLAGMPRKRHNLKLVVAPYEQRIRELEAQLQGLK